MHRIKKDDGAIVIEASIALPIYMFLIVTILTIVNICYAQAKVQIALNTSAKQMSECMYIYYATGADSMFTGSGGTSSAAMSKVSEYMDEVLEIFGIENEYLSGFSEALGNTSIADIVANELSEALTRQVVESVLMTTENESADEFYEKMNMDNVEYKAILDTSGEKLTMGMSYEIEVIQLFNIDISFDFYNVATTSLWADGETNANQ